MQIGIGLGLGRAWVGGSAPLWTPADMLAGEQAAMLAPSQYATTMWQDIARTIPAAIGQPVASALLLYSGGVYAEQATLAQRPRLMTDARGTPRLEFNNSQGQTLAAASVNFSNTNKVTIFAAGGTIASTIQSIVVFGNAASTPGSFDFGTFNGGLLCYVKGTGEFGGRKTDAFAPMKFLTTVVLDLSGTTAATETPTFRVNGSTPALTAVGSADSGSGNFGNSPLTFGAGQGFFGGHLYDTLIRGVASTAPEIAAMENYLNALIGFTSLTVFPSAISDSGPAVNKTTHLSTSTFGHADFVTDATQIIVGFNTALYTPTSNIGEVGVWVDGAFHQSIASTANGDNVGTVQLPTGSKTVSLVNGLESAPAGAPLGSFVTSITPNALMTPVAPAAANRILLYADSIGVGGNADIPTRDAWAMRVRAAYQPNSFSLEAWGYRALYDDCNTAPLRASFVARLAAYAPVRIWLAIGTNDYGLNKWTAAAYGAAYAALLDDLHTALPAALIYAQTPLLRNVETANGSGSTLGDYRAQIATAVSTRTAYATLVDGTAIMTTASLADGLHPTTAGHVLYANAVKSVLGIA